MKLRLSGFNISRVINGGISLILFNTITASSTGNKNSPIRV